MSQKGLQLKHSYLPLEEEMIAIIQSIYFELTQKRISQKEIQVTFYPYAGFNNTIRLRQGILKIRISDLLLKASSSVREAIAWILISKLLKKKIPTKSTEIVKQYIQLPSVKLAIHNMRRTRGFKYISGEQGEFYNLKELFKELNDLYFDNTLECPILTWSRTFTSHILGHYDSIHKTLSVSRSLDKKNIPHFFISYVLYHEMLHIKHKAYCVNGRLKVHTPEFIAEEKKFRQYTNAINWMKQFTKQLNRC